MMTKWQVFRRVTDGYEEWDADQEGEVFDTEAEADRRASELDSTIPQSWGWHGARAVDD
jgi:hypothetical protein